MDDFDMGALEEMNFNTGFRTGRDNLDMMRRIERLEAEVRRAQREVQDAQERLRAAARTLAQFKSGGSRMKMRNGLSSNFNQPKFS